MPSVLVLEKESSNTYRLPVTNLLPALTASLFWTFFSVTALAVFIPLNPSMPGGGVDYSYAYAMNQAVARHLTFGQQIVFTYGPYASVVTRAYDPATHLRMMWGNLILGISYLSGALFLASRSKRYVLVVLLLFLATFGPGEMLLLSYPLVLLLCVLKYVGAQDSATGSRLTRGQLLAAVLMWLTLGLLPLVKGTLLLPFAVTLVVCSGLLLYRGRYVYGFISLLTPIAACLGLWLIAGQSLRNIYGFLHGMASLTSGFTEAMSLPWAILPSIAGDALVVCFLVLSALIFLSIWRCPGLGSASKCALSLVCCVFVLVAFKHGFVTPMNVWTSFASLAVYSLIIALLHVDRLLVWSLVLATLLTTAIFSTRDPVLVKEVHQRFGIGTSWATGPGRRDIVAFCAQRMAGATSRTTFESTWRTYRNAWDGFYARVTQPNDLEVRYAAAKKQIRSDYALPAVRGSADLYNYDQSLLLASDNSWDPRPVVQSYSAYTPDLARLNEQHLRGANAPDWVWFDMKTIDGRLPSLDDGLSWPAFLDNYRAVFQDAAFVVMHKKAMIHSQSRYEEGSAKTYDAGELVTLPKTDGPLFAQIDWQPTLAGRLLVALFNPPELHIVLGLENGETRTFRVVSNMLRTEVLLSPLVSNTQEFAALMEGGGQLQNGNRVRTISATPSYGGSLYWSGTYRLTLKEYVAQ